MRDLLLGFGYVPISGSHASTAFDHVRTSIIESLDPPISCKIAAIFAFYSVPIQVLYSRSSEDRPDEMRSYRFSPDLHT